MPPPSLALPPLAEFPESVLLVIVSVPTLLMPPPLFWPVPLAELRRRCGW
jgi:hypothetical protein